ncbi:MAG TPA: aldehyde dehydrogenase family protein [Dactylosporangium sp.]|jgi:succinate-semialdehyde dehydrogenase/glutarate-semialdehyde dehydrogenase|nr:aldehyde dehydrogenase family protein [Dactylosporangium sp.]
MSPIATVNPYTAETVREFEPMGAGAVDAAVRRAARAFTGWRSTPATDRAEVLHRAARLAADRAEELEALITLETGKLIRHSRAEVDLAVRTLRYYADEGPALIADEPLKVERGTAVLRNDPLGPVLGVQPGHFPFFHAVRFAAPNLVLGNTVLVRPAAGCPQTALALAELFAEAGAGEGCFEVLLVEDRDVGAVVEHEQVRAASLTDGDAGGAGLAERAGRRAKKTVLDLGGRDPFIVLDGEHLERTVEAAVAGRLHNMGQGGVSARRMIVVRKVYAEFVALLAERFHALRPGDPADASTTLAPLCSEAAAARLMEQLDDACERGATAVTGGHRIDRRGAFVEPTVLTGVRPDMRAYHEELAGPVAVVFPVDDEEAAVALANDSPYGLGGAVFAADVLLAHAVADRLETGMVWINHPTTSEPNLPFGGIKRSGYGRELAHAGITEFANRRLVVENSAYGPVADALG